MAEEVKIVISADARKAEKELDKIVKRLEKLDKEGTKTGKAFDQLQGKLKRVGSKAVDFGKQSEFLQKKTSKLGDAFKKAGAKIAAWAPLLGGAVLIAGARKFIKTQVEIETALANVATIADQTMLSLREIDDGIMKIAGGSAQSVKDNVDGFYQAISAGIPQIKGAGGAFEFLDQAQKAATAGLSTVAEAVDAGTTAVNVFGVDSKEAFDKLFQTVKDGKTTLPELARNMGQAAATAKAAGLDFDEFLAATAQVTKGGVATARAFTAVRASAQALAAPTGEIRDRFTAMGLSMNDVSAEAIKRDGFVNVLNRVFDATGGNIEEMRKLIPEIEGIKGALLLGGDAAEKYAVQLDRIKNASGAAGKALDEVEKSVGAQSGKLSASIDVLGRTLFRSLGPALASSLKGTVDQVQNLTRGIQGLADMITIESGPIADAIDSWFATGEFKGGTRSTQRGGTSSAAAPAPFRTSDPMRSGDSVLASGDERAAGAAAAKAAEAEFDKAAKKRASAAKAGASARAREEDALLAGLGKISELRADIAEGRTESAAELSVIAKDRATGVKQGEAAGFQDRAKAGLAAQQAFQPKIDKAAASAAAPGVAGMALSAAGGFAASALMGAGQQLFDLLKLSPDEFGKALDEFVGAFGTTVTNIFANLPSLFKKIVPLLRDVGMSIIEALPTFIEELIAVLIKELPHFVTALTIQLSIALVAKLPEIVAGLAKGIAEGIGDLFGGGDSGIPIIGGLLDSLNPFAKGGIVPGLQKFAGGGMVDDIASQTNGGRLAVVHPGERVLTQQTTEQLERALVNAMRGVQGGGGETIVRIETDGRSAVLDAALETSRLRHMRRQGIPVRTSRDTMGRGIPALSSPTGARG